MDDIHLNLASRVAAVLGSIVLAALPGSAAATSPRWSLLTGQQKDLTREHKQFPQIPVYYCASVTSLGTLSDEAVQANLQGVLNEWFHAGADLRPYLAGVDTAACARGSATAGTILITTQLDLAGTGKLFNVAVSTVGSPPQEINISSVTVTLYTGERLCPVGICANYNYVYRGTDGSAGYDLWTVLLTAVGEAVGLAPGNDPLSVMNETIGNTLLRRHLLSHDFANMFSLYPPQSYGAISNEGFTTPNGDTSHLLNATQLRFAFSESAIGADGTSLTVSRSALEPYGATEVSMEQPAACYLTQPVISRAFRFLVGLAGFNLASSSFGNSLVTYTNDGTSNGRLRNSLSVSNGYRAPAVGCSPSGYLVSWVDQSNQTIHISWSADAQTWTASILTGGPKSYLTPALAFEPVSGQFLLLYADSTASGALNIAMSADATGKTFGAPVAIVEPAKTGSPPPPATEFTPGLACMPSGGLCLVAWGPGTTGTFAFDDANSQFAYADIKVTGGTFTVPDMNWQTVRGWGLSVGANASTFLISATDIPGATTRFLATTKSNGTPTIMNGNDGSQGSALSVVWGDVYNRWFMWGTGNYVYGN